MTIVLLACGCGGAGDGSGGAPDAMVDPTRGMVTGTIEYAGSQTGKLTVGVFADNPPAGPPIQFFIVDEPEFPQGYTLESIEPGTMYVIAVLDIGSDNPTIPGDEDLLTATDEPLEIAGGDMRVVDLTLMDP